MVILSKACKPDNFELNNSLKLSFMNIWGPRSNFVHCESFLESNSPGILALYETNLDDSIDSGNFSVRGYLPLIWKDSSTHAWSHSSCEGRTSFCPGLISRKLCRFLCMLWLALLHPVSYWFFLCWWPSLSLCRVFDSISSTMDEVLSINPSANVFFFGDFNVHHKDWLTYSGWTDRFGELCYNFSISNDLTQMINFPTRSQTMILIVLPFWIYLFFLLLVFVLCCCLSFHWLSIIFTTGCPVSMHCLWLLSCWLEWSSWSFERCSMGGYL